jgi:hypothetical protein
MRWLDVLWQAMWPNIFAPSAFSIAAVGWAHVRTKRHMTRQHEALKTHITRTQERP